MTVVGDEKCPADQATVGRLRASYTCCSRLANEGRLAWVPSRGGESSERTSRGSRGKAPDRPRERRASAARERRTTCLGAFQRRRVVRESESGFQGRSPWINKR